MNKLTKVGCSALCGSLAAISAANAGDLTVTGSAHLTYVSLGGTGDETVGNPIGMQSNVTFKGSGELDNGWTFALSIADGDGGAYSSSNIDIVMGGLGSINFDQGDSGNGIAAYDNVMPTAWEEAHGAGLSGDVKTVLGAGASQNVMYTTPTLFGTTIALTYAHDYGVTDVNDKTTKAGENATGKAVDATIKINPSLGSEILSGLNLYAGASVIEAYDNGSAHAADEDNYQGVLAFTYALGPVEIGYMGSAMYDGDEGYAADGAAASTDYHTYKNQAFGVAFNVNDDFSVSYGEYETRKAGYNNTAVQVTGEAGRLVEVVSWQAAYTMGGASFRVADVEVDNAGFSAGNSQSATIVSLGLAF
jgi:hypothetical protein